MSSLEKWRDGHSNPLRKLYTFLWTCTYWYVCDFCFFLFMMLFSVKIRTSFVFPKESQEKIVTSAEDTWPKMRSAVMNGVDDPSFVKEPVPRTRKKNTTENVGLMRVEIDKVEEIYVTQKILMGILLLLLLLRLMSLWHVFFFVSKLDGHLNWGLTPNDEWVSYMQKSALRSLRFLVSKGQATVDVSETLHQFYW